MKTIFTFFQVPSSLFVTCRASFAHSD
jgi:hypothetical protein